MKLQEVRNMLGNDFEDIISEFKREGIIFESQFSSLYSMFCKKYTYQLVELLEKETQLEVSHGYAVPYFYYFDTNRFDRSEAPGIAQKYHIDKGNMYENSFWTG